MKITISFIFSSRDDFCNGDEQDRLSIIPDSETHFPDPASS
ncbi:MAG: hypothetical protein ACJ749_02340 [Flavisolibacter sp.]